MTKMILSLSVVLALCSFTGKAQKVENDSNFSLTYYSTNELGFSFFKKKKFYGEFRLRQNKDVIETSSPTGSYSVGNNEYVSYAIDKPSGYHYKDLYYSFLLKNDLTLHADRNIYFTWGLGWDYSYRYDDYLIIPVGITAKNLFNTSWLDANISLEGRSAFDSTKDLEFEPKIGFSISF